MPTWNQSLAIGVPLIDLQHQQLFDQMDRLVDAIKNKKDFRQVDSILKFLRMYVDNHFGYEEQCMHINKCPAAAQNHNAHEYFVNRLGEIERQMQTAPNLEMFAAKITEELINWFITHIRSIDHQLGQCISH
ncbi:MAG TPA: hemerythrin family protein [Candidatus Obscuribacterales bacterium]